MELWIQEKYILLLSSRLEGFKRKGPQLFTCRCPLCGDSQKNQNKKRGYFFRESLDFYFHCHNCGINRKFPKFLKAIDPGLYAEAMKEAYLHPTTRKEALPDLPRTLDDGVKIDLPNVGSLGEKHPAYQYLKSRKIPRQLFREILYTDNFKELVNGYYPKDEPKFKATNTKAAKPRIIFPFYDRNKKFFGFQGRALDPSDEIRYISIVLDESKPKAFGLDKINFNKKYYVLEGPIDSFFFENAMAACGSDVVSVLTSIGCNRENGVIVMDAEPRNKEIIGKLEGAIDRGWRVVVWPDWWPYKDVNDAILGGYTASQIMHVVDSNIYSGIEARLRVAAWRKIQTL